MQLEYCEIIQLVAIELLLDVLLELYNYSSSPLSRSETLWLDRPVALPVLTESSKRDQERVNASALIQRQWFRLGVNGWRPKPASQFGFMNLKDAKFQILFMFDWLIVVYFTSSGKQILQAYICIEAWQ